jgi:hypothetical protein
LWQQTFRPSSKRVHVSEHRGKTVGQLSPQALKKLAPT